jgi:Mce-associated membrane protein
MTDEPARTDPAPPGDSEPGDTTPADADQPARPDEHEAPARPAPARASRRPMVAGLSASVAVAVAAALVVAFSGGPQAIPGVALHPPVAPPPANLALADPAATRAVLGQVDRTVARIFAYDATHRDDAAVGADRDLTGAARGQYDSLMATARQLGPAHGLVLTASVVDSAVTGLTARDASALLLLDQRDTRDGGTVTASTAVLTVTARLAGTLWQISAIAAQPGGPPAPPSVPPTAPVPSATPAGVADARDRALAAAERAGATLTSADWQHIDLSLAAWRAVATGALFGQFTAGSRTFSEQVVAAKAVTTGVCVAAGVETVDPLSGHATVIVVVQVTRSSAAAPVPTTAILPLVLDLDRVASGWRAAALKQVTTN